MRIELQDLMKHIKDCLQDAISIKREYSSYGNIGSAQAMCPIITNLEKAKKEVAKQLEYIERFNAM